MAEEVGVAFVRLVPSMRGFGPEAQQAMNDAMQGPARNAGEEAGGEAGGKFGQAFKGALLGAGLLAGAALIGGVTEALDQSKIVGKLRAQLGATPAEAKKYGEIAGELFAGAIVTDFQQGADTIRAVMSSGLVPAGATNKQIKSIATNAADLANTFDIDLQAAANAAGGMMKNGLAKNGTEAFDLLAAGMTGLGPASEDLVETVSEYGPVFKSAGLSGQTALGLIKQAVQGGWVKDTDKIGDAFKELNLRATEGSKGVTEAFKTLGLDAKQTGDDIAAGGARGEKAMGQVMDQLKKLGPNSQEAKQIVSTLFGGPGEDLGAALFALDIGKASKAMDGAKGSADKLGDGLRDNAGTKVTQFTRSLQQNVVEFLGGTVIPAMDDFRGYVTRSFAGVWAEAGKGSDGTADRIIGFVTVLGQRLGQKIVELAPKAVEGLLGLGGKIADFVTANPGKVFKIAAIAAALTIAIVALPLLVGAALSAAAALMMIGFAKRLISFLGENIPKWWDAFTGWVGEKASQAGTMFSVLGSAIGRWFSGLWSKYVSGPVSRQWTSFIGTVQALPGRAVGALAALGSSLATTSSRAWQRFKDSAARKAVDFIAWVGGMPGRITRGIGSLGSLLYNKGQDVVRGLWNGIKSMGGWLRDTLTGWAKDIIPGPVAKALGIGSPSKVMAKAVGRWLPPGIAEGWKANLGDLTAMGAATATAATSALPAGAAPVRAAAAAAGTTVVIDGRNMPRALEEWLRHNVRTIGGGSTDKWLGQGAG
ncbi:phage tail tape measure protein [Streptomyces europaeiscabiei]|uniref:Phage tail tape measure protein n=1 Tax=Streptomyces europaeiscabiei TaxID=146819 RepID=A0ABU4NRH9_9ACTN|nr:phage tail tape measure protein [Streptomyces europaeiscabiei]MDX3555278.1 phage tail tape measure protein [Streptomyces europaeiscabiei]MDX3705292.1 phage tail tape measure protein [Streptomyces europaeiscabiei]